MISYLYSTQCRQRHKALYTVHTFSTSFWFRLEFSFFLNVVVLINRHAFPRLTNKAVLRLAFMSSSFQRKLNFSSICGESSDLSYSEILHFLTTYGGLIPNNSIERKVFCVIRLNIPNPRTRSILRLEASSIDETEIKRGKQQERKTEFVLV